MEDGASLPLALHQLESAIDDEADPSVLRAVRQRLMERHAWARHMPKALLAVCWPAVSQAHRTH